MSAGDLALPALGSFEKGPEHAELVLPPDQAAEGTSSEPKATRLEPEKDAPRTAARGSEGSKREAALEEWRDRRADADRGLFRAGEQILEHRATRVFGGQDDLELARGAGWISP